MEQPLEKPPALPGHFVELVKRALENLHDYPYLQRHLLAQEDRLIQGHAGRTAAERLHHALVAAIEGLNPGPDVPAHAPNSRLYSVLALHYIQGMTAEQAGQALGLSRRQVHRDLRRGEESVAAVLWSERTQAPAPEAPGAEVSSFQEEMARLEVRPTPLDLRDVLQRAAGAVERLAAQRGVRLDIALPGEEVTVSTDGAMAQQVLVSALSQAVQQAQPGMVLARLAGDARGVELALHFWPRPHATSAPPLGAMAAQVAARLGWEVHEANEESERVVTIRMAAPRPMVLVIDDNEGLVKLLDRYLTGHACRVLAAATGQEALALAGEHAPDAILLDVMMPEMDGWEVLQRLQARPETASVPVIVCSVFNDPELAYSLGAAGFLGKPVRREEVLAALRRLRVL